MLTPHSNNSIGDSRDFSRNSSHFESSNLSISDNTTHNQVLVDNTKPQESPKPTQKVFSYDIFKEFSHEDGETRNGDKFSYFYDSFDNKTVSRNYDTNKNYNSDEIPVFDESEIIKNVDSSPTFNDQSLKDPKPKSFSYDDYKEYIDEKDDSSMDKSVEDSITSKYIDKAQTDFDKYDKNILLDKFTSSKTNINTMEKPFDFEDSNKGLSYANEKIHNLDDIEKAEIKPEDRDDKVLLYPDMKAKTWDKSIVQDSSGENRGNMIRQDQRDDDNDDDAAVKLNVNYNSNDETYKDTSMSKSDDNSNEVTERNKSFESNDKNNGDEESNQGIKTQENIIDKMNKPIGGELDEDNVKKEVADERGKEVLFIDPKIASHLEPVNKRIHINRHSKQHGIRKNNIEVAPQQNTNKIKKRKRRRRREKKSKKLPFNDRIIKMHKNHKNHIKIKTKKKRVHKYVKFDLEEGVLSKLKGNIKENFPMNRIFVEYYHRNNDENIEEDFLRNRKINKEGRGNFFKTSHFSKSDILEEDVDTIKKYLKSTHKKRASLNNHDDLWNKKESMGSEKSLQYDDLKTSYRRHHNVFRNADKRHHPHHTPYNAREDPRETSFKFYETYGDKGDVVKGRIHNPNPLDKDMVFSNLHRRFHAGDDSHTGNWEAFKSLIDDIRSKHGSEREHGHEGFVNHHIRDDDGDKEDDVKQNERNQNDRIYPNEKDEREEEYHREKHRRRHHYRNDHEDDAGDRDQTPYYRNRDAESERNQKSKSEKENEEKHYHNPHRNHYEDVEHEDNREPNHAESEEIHPHYFHNNHMEPNVGFSFQKNFLRKVNEANKENNDDEEEGDEENDEPIREEKTANIPHDSRNKNEDVEALARMRLYSHRHYHPHKRHHRKWPDIFHKFKHYKNPEIQDSEAAWLFHNGSPYNLSDRKINEFFHHRDNNASNPKTQIDPKQVSKDYYSNLPLGYYGPLDDETNVTPPEKSSDAPKPIYLYGKGVMDVHSKGENLDDKLAIDNNLPNDDHPAHYLFRKLAQQGQMGDAHYEHSLDDQLGHHSTLQDVSLSAGLSNSLPDQPSLSNDASITTRPELVKNPDLQDHSVVGGIPIEPVDGVLNFHNSDKSVSFEANNLPDAIREHQLLKLDKSESPLTVSREMPVENQVNKAQVQSTENQTDNSITPLNPNQFSDYIQLLEVMAAIQKNASLQQSSTDGSSNPSSKDELHSANPLDYDIPQFPQRSNSEGVNSFFDHEIARISQHVHELPIVADKQMVNPLQDLLATFAKMSKNEKSKPLDNDVTPDTADQRVNLAHPGDAPEDSSSKVDDNETSPPQSNQIILEKQLLPYHLMSSSLSPNHDMSDKPGKAMKESLSTHSSNDETKPPPSSVVVLIPYKLPSDTNPSATSSVQEINSAPHEVSSPIQNLQKINSLLSLVTHNISSDRIDPTPELCKSFQATNTDGRDIKHPSSPLPEPPLPPKEGISPYQVLTTEETHGTKRSDMCDPTSLECRCRLITETANDNKGNLLPEPPLPPEQGVSPYQVLTSEGSSLPPAVMLPLRPSMNELNSFKSFTDSIKSDCESDDPRCSSFSKYKYFSHDMSMSPEKFPELCNSYDMSNYDGLKGSDSQFHEQFFSDMKFGEDAGGSDGAGLGAPEGSQPFNRQAFSKACELYKMLAARASNAHKDEQAPKEITPDADFTSHYGFYHKPGMMSFSSPSTFGGFSLTNKQQSMLKFQPTDKQEFSKACEAYKMLAAQGSNSHSDDLHSSSGVPVQVDQNSSPQPKPPLPPMLGLSPYQVLTSEGSHCGKAEETYPTSVMNSMYATKSDPFPELCKSYEILRAKDKDGKGLVESLAQHLNTGATPIDKQAFIKACDLYKILAAQGSNLQKDIDPSKASSDVYSSHFSRPGGVTTTLDTMSISPDETPACSPPSIGPEPPQCEKTDDLPPCSPLSIGPEPPMCKKVDDLPPVSPLSIGPEPSYNPKSDGLPPCSPLSVGPEPQPATLNLAHSTHQSWSHVPSWFNPKVTYSQNSNYPCYSDCKRNIGISSDVKPPCSLENDRNMTKSETLLSISDDSRKNNESKLAHDIDNILKNEDTSSSSSPSSSHLVEDETKSKSKGLNIVDAIAELKRKSLVDAVHRSKIFSKPAERKKRKKNRHKGGNRSLRN